MSNDFWDRDLWHRVLLRLYAFTPEYYGSSGPPLDPGIYDALELWYEVRRKDKRGTRVIAVRYYPPVPDSPFTWAHVERGIIDLGDGHHCHLFRDRSGDWKVSLRDILKGRITREEADILNRRLGRQ